MGLYDLLLIAASAIEVVVLIVMVVCFCITENYGHRLSYKTNDRLSACGMMLLLTSVLISFLVSFLVLLREFLI